MPTNIEIKARASDFEGQLVRAKALAASVEDLLQEDTFFHCANGRLKLRDLGPGREGYLVFYKRDDLAGPKRSCFETSVVRDTSTMRILLARSIGIGKTVRKKRTLILSGQTRLHFDDVELLGRFIEIEVCLTPGQDAREGSRLAQDFMQRLGIKAEDLIETAYIDMLP